MAILNLRDSTAAVDIASGVTVDFDTPVLIDNAKGGTVNVGTRINVQIRVTVACELRVSYAYDGPAAAPTFRDRGTVEKLVAGADFRASFAAIGTNVRLSLKNIHTASGNADVYTTIV